MFRDVESFPVKCKFWKPNLHQKSRNVIPIGMIHTIFPRIVVHARNRGNGACTIFLPQFRPFRIQVHATEIFATDLI